MPSTETQGQQPEERTGGVGSLPGPKDEQGVAVLPEERITKATEAPRQEPRDEKCSLPDIPKERATEVTEVPRQEPHDEKCNLPDIPKESAGLSGVGVSGATDPLKRDTQSRVCSRFHLSK